MHADETVVQVEAEELKTAARKLGAEDHGDGAANHEKENAPDGVLHTDDFVVEVDAEIAGPGRLVHWGAVVHRRCHAFGPLQPVIQRADAEEEADDTADGTEGPGWFGGPGFPAQQYAHAAGQQHADDHAKDLAKKAACDS